MQKKTLWILGGVGVSIVIIGAIALFSGGKSNVVVTTENVRRGNIVQTVDVTGEVESLQDIDLSFSTSGIVGSLAFAVGDRVSAGSVIASLAAGELGADVARAQALLEQRLAGATAEEIAVSTSQVNVAKAALASAQADLAIKEADIARITAQAGSSLSAEKAQSDLERTRLENSIKVAQAREDYILSMEGAMVSVRGGLGSADQILGRENALQNNDCEPVLGRQDPTTVSAANFAFDNAANARDGAETAVYALTSLSTDAEIEAAQLLVEDALEKTKTTLYHVARVLDATVSDTVSCSLSDVTAYKATIETARSAMQADGVSVANGEQVYELAQVTADSAELAAENAVKAATQNFASSQIGEENEIAAAQSAVTIAKANVAARLADLSVAEAQLAKIEAKPRAVDVASLRADLSAAQARYAKSLITAPISGVLTDITLDVGEQAAAGALVATIQADAGQFKIPVDISESDIAKVTVGDSATVTFDAFGDDTAFTATVALINPAEKIIEGVVYYEATVIITDTNSVEAIRSGMSADVTIVTGEAENALYVSQRSVLEEEGMKFVRIPKNDAGEFEKRTVTVGMRADDGYLEIIEGVQEGEAVILSIKEQE